MKTKIENFDDLQSELNTLKTLIEMAYDMHLDRPYPDDEEARRAFD